MNHFISVIVPVYNVAAYLPECLDSILCQDYRNLEVLLINDGSTDNSGSICDEYAARDNRIRVLHQKNGGAAAAKNAGLRVATGEFLSFVDSDDFLEPGAYSHMVSLLSDHKADVVQCSYRDIFRDQTVDRIHKPGRSVLSTTEYLSLFTQDWTCGLLWDKLFRRSLFDGILFEEGHKIDDEYFTYQGIMNAKTVVCDDRIIYNYRKRRSSVMFSPESGKQIVLDRVDYLGKRRRNVICRFPELRKIFDRHFLEMMVILSRDPMGSEESIHMIRKQLRAYFRECGHTSADIRLWPSMAQLQLGLVKPVAEQNAADKACMDHYFE